MKIISKINFLIVLLLFLTTNIVGAQTGLNAGFVNGLWYSKTPFFSGDEVRIYTVIQNQSGFDIMGTVQFFDNKESIGQSDFSVVNGRLIEKWADWEPKKGGHEISVTIVDTKKIEIGKDPEAINLSSNLSISEKYEVDLDTDGDGVGDQNDLDDDNDGSSDEEEEQAGTNSLVFNMPVVSVDEEEIVDTSKQEAISIEGQTMAKKIIQTTKEVASNISEKATEVVESTKKVLEKQKEKVEEELEQQKQEKVLKDEPKIDKDKNPYIASIIGSIPELKVVYNFLLGVLIYILNSWWILLGTIFILGYFIWKIIKKRFRRSF
jgi:hypothetical protein